MFLGFWGCSDSGEQILGGCNKNAVADSCGICDGDGSTCNISYSLIIQPIFTNNCSPCHTSESSGNLNLSTWGNTIDNTSTNGPVINNKHDSSLLWQKINNGLMPPSGAGLSTEEIFLIATWIDEGALDN